jgi:outer membrane murein-binding lipoprotein Lpp
MKHLFFIITITSLFLFSGCSENQKEHDAKVAQQARESLLKELKAKEEAQRKQEAEHDKQSKLSRMGFQKTSDGKIIIDMNKTKSYFQMLAQQMQSKVEEMNKELESGTIQEKEAGIEVNQTHINIDLNKTKSFLDNLGKKMQGYVKEFEGMVQELNGTK